jgi:hypothetical protein
MGRSILCFVLVLLFITFINLETQAAEPYSVIFKNGGSITAIHHVFDGQMIKIYLLNPADGILAVDKSLIEKPTDDTRISKRQKASASKV